MHHPNLVMASKTWLLPLILLTATVHFRFVTTLDERVACLNNGNYDSEDIYRTDLTALLRSLSTNIADNGFYHSSVGQANAIALCRADIQLSQCRGCVDVLADQILRECPNRYQAIMWQQYCMVRYSNDTIFGKLATKPANDSQYLRFVDYTREYDNERDAIFAELRDEAANGGPLRKAAAGNRTTQPHNETVYAMAQCTPDLSPGDCTSCLVQAAGYISQCCVGTPGVLVYMPSCILRYETTLFYNITRIQEPLDLAISPSPSQPTPGNDANHRTRKIIIIVVSIVGILTVAFCVGIFARKRMKEKKKGEHEIGEDGAEISVAECKQYNLDEIKEATDNFSDDNKLGQGGFGIVYKGKLKDGQEIAVKRLSQNSYQGEAEFKNEVKFVARLQHRNLVRLLGFAFEGNERLLVYEFIQNGSLDDSIFDPTKSSNLDWDKRYEIIEGVARGLLYVHQDSRLQIIHGDLKASNVLLDEEMNPKISDFGLAKLLAPDATHEKTSRVVGTYGYMAPEYASHGKSTTKSDVYSFGVLVLEIVAGQKTICSENDEETSGDLLSRAWRSWREGRGENIIDNDLRADPAARRDVLKCIHIALLCVQKDPNNRPTMAVVVLLLSSSFPSLPAPSEPGFYNPSSFSKVPNSQGEA